MRSSIDSSFWRKFAICIALLFSGVALILVSSIESPLALLGLLIHFFGLMGIYFAISQWMKMFRKPVPDVSEAELKLIGRNPGIGLIRLGSILALVIGCGLWIWGAGVDIKELCQLLLNPRVANAQAIISPNTAPGFVNYSFRANSKVAPVGRFQVPPTEYAKYKTGRLISITYYDPDPRIHRIGAVTFGRLLFQIFYWAALFANGAAYLALPLWILEYRRPKPFFALSKLAWVSKK